MHDNQVFSANGEPLAGVLVSISGENFRQNIFTDDSGALHYSQLVSYSQECWCGM